MLHNEGSYIGGIDFKPITSIYIYIYVIMAMNSCIPSYVHRYVCT